MQARQIARRKRKELGQEPPRGYVLRDAWALWKNLKRGRIVSYQDERRRMERYIIGPLGGRQIDEITAPLVIQTVKSIERAGHQATLKRVLMRTREVMDLAVCAGYIHHNPIDRVSRVFAAPIVKPMPSVHWRELPRVMEIVKSAPKRTQLLFAWACLSLLRPIETVKVRWDWIDGDVLIIPATEMKKSREHRLPLLPIMLDVLQAAKTESPHPNTIDKAPDIDELPLPTPRPFVDAISPMMFGPNISGGASSALLSSSTVTGCFQKGNSPQPSHEGGSNANRELTFDASSVSVIYGNGMTVQPASLELLACIRV